MKTILCVVICALVSAGGAQAGSEGCRPVHAIGVGQDLGGGNTAATLSRGGVLNGTTSAHFDITGATGSVLSIAGTLVLTTKHGSVTVSLTGTLDAATGAFTATGPLSGGTGSFAGTTGTLTLTGVENLSTGVFTETVAGTLCGGEDD